MRIRWKGLGVVTSPSGCGKDHMDYLVNKNIAPRNYSITSSYLQKHDEYQAAFTSILKSIDYNLPVTSLTPDQCRIINSKLHKKILLQIGVDSHMPLAYRYALVKYQGLASLGI